MRDSIQRQLAFAFGFCVSACTPTPSPSAPPTVSAEPSAPAPEASRAEGPRRALAVVVADDGAQLFDAPEGGIPRRDRLPLGATTFVIARAEGCVEASTGDLCAPRWLVRAPG